MGNLTLQTEQGLTFEQAKEAIQTLEKDTNETLLSILNSCSDAVIIYVTGTEWNDDDTRYPIRLNFNKLKNINTYSGKVHGNNATFSTCKRSQ